MTNEMLSDQAAIYTHGSCFWFPILADFKLEHYSFLLDHCPELLYYASDLLWLDCKDLRGLPLIGRKR